VRRLASLANHRCNLSGVRVLLAVVALRSFDVVDVRRATLLGLVLEVRTPRPRSYRRLRRTVVRTSSASLQARRTESHRHPTSLHWSLLLSRGCQSDAACAVNLVRDRHRGGAATTGSSKFPLAPRRSWIIEMMRCEYVEHRGRSRFISRYFMQKGLDSRREVFHLPLRMQRCRRPRRDCTPSPLRSSDGCLSCHVRLEPGVTLWSSGSARRADQGRSGHHVVRWIRGSVSTCVIMLPWSIVHRSIDAISVETLCRRLQSMRQSSCRLPFGPFNLTCLAADMSIELGGLGGDVIRTTIMLMRRFARRGTIGFMHGRIWIASRLLSSSHQHGDARWMAGDGRRHRNRLVVRRPENGRPPPTREAVSPMLSGMGTTRRCGRHC
jgi:hypothetical protein